MDVDSPPTSPQSTSNTDSKPSQQQQSTAITPTTRISELNQIDTSISTLLSSASAAIAILSNSENNNNRSTSDSTDTNSAKSSFQTAAKTYFSTLSSIEVRLRRQVYALEEAGLIPSGSDHDTRRGRNLNDDNNDISIRRKGGQGPLDPSWLNARMNDNVEVQKKKELLELGGRSPVASDRIDNNDDNKNQIITTKDADDDVDMN